MIEVEVKILDIDEKRVEERLLSLGAKKTFDGEIQALYYDFPDRSIGADKGVFRLRKEGSRAVLTYKGHVDSSSAKIKEERQTEVSDFDAMRAIIESLGFTVWLEMRKHRRTYELDGLYFELDRHLDRYSYIPEFLEIEGQDKESVFLHAEMLGFKREDCRPWDVVQVARYYELKKGT